MAPPTTTFRRLPLGLCLLALPACAQEQPKVAAHTNNDYQVGRYRIVTLPGSGDTIEIDTANGKTWVLRRNAPADGGGIVGWDQIDDYP